MFYSLGLDILLNILVTSLKILIICSYISKNDSVDLELDIDATSAQIDSKGVQDLKHELDTIIEPMKAPDMFPPHPVKCEDPQAFPESYNSNSKKEELVTYFYFM